MGKRTTERLFASVELDGTSQRSAEASFGRVTFELQHQALEAPRHVLWDTLELSIETEVDEDITSVGGTHTERRMLNGSVLAVKL